MPTPPGFASVSIELTQTNVTRPAYITFGIDPSATDGYAIAETIRVNFEGTASLKYMFDTSVTMTAIRVSLGTDGSADIVTEVPYNVVCSGSAAGTSVPPNCAVLVHKATALGGRRGRGRWYMPWAVGEGNVDEGGIISGGTLTSLQNNCDNFLSSMASLVPIVVLHEPGKTVIPPPSVVTKLTVDKLIATQRRRLGR
jgi:hypothetical protein